MVSVLIFFLTKLVQGCCEIENGSQKGKVRGENGLEEEEKILCV